MELSDGLVGLKNHPGGWFNYKTRTKPRAVTIAGYPKQPEGAKQKVWGIQLLASRRYGYANANVRSGPQPSSEPHLADIDCHHEKLAHCLLALFDITPSPHTRIKAPGLIQAFAHIHSKA